MTSATSARTGHRARRDPIVHLFPVGVTVRLKSAFATPLPIGTYKVTRQLPPLGDHLQYRVLRDGETFERVTTQDNLELVKVSSDLSLLERTFGNG